MPPFAGGSEVAGNSVVMVDAGLKLCCIVQLLAWLAGAYSHCLYGHAVLWGAKAYFSCLPISSSALAFIQRSPPGINGSRASPV